MGWPGQYVPQAWQTLFEHHPDVILIIDRAGTCVAANPAASELTGLSRDEIVGQPFESLALQNEQTRLRQALSTALGGASSPVHHSLPRHNNGAIAMQSTLLPVPAEDTPTCVIVLSRPATPDAREAEQHYRSLLIHHPDATYSLDLQGRFTEANDPALELAGLSREELLGRNFIDFVPEENMDEVSQAFEQLLAGQPIYLDTIAVRADGTRFPAHVTGVPIIVGGQVIGIHGITHDISRRRAAEHQARALAARLTDTLESITDAFFTVDRDWHYTYVNSEGENLMRFPREALMGQTVWEMFPELIGTTVENNYRLAMEKRRTVHFEYYFPPYQHWFDIHAYPTEEGLAVYFRDITERKQSEAEIEFLAMYDPLTHLPNRRLMDDRLEHALNTARRNHRFGAVLFLDLDNFKLLNDSLGHQAGDILLQETARRLRECTEADETVARFGGDEFLVIAENLGASESSATRRAEELGDRIMARLAQPYNLAGNEAFSGASIGIALLGASDDSPQDILRQADIALHQAKAAGRRNIKVFDPGMQDAIDSRASLEAGLRNALSEGQILPWYQPQYDHRGKISGAEALARWQHPGRGLVPPDEFIPLAEDTGLILALGQSMLEQVCRDLATWPNEHLADDFCVAVNVSAREFHHPEFIEGFMAIIEASGADPRRLQLELTESLLLQDINDTIAKITRLKQCGISVSLDDFGTGYSSLYYLKRLPLDQIKIDRGFVRDLLEDSNDAAIVRAIIGLATNLELNVIAEGVESAEVRDRLGEYGCQSYQGYFFSRPVTAGDFTGLLAAGSG